MGARRPPFATFENVAFLLSTGGTKYGCADFAVAILDVGDERQLARVVESLLAESEASNGPAIELVPRADYPVLLGAGADKDGWDSEGIRIQSGAERDRPAVVHGVGIADVERSRRVANARGRP